MNRLWPSVVLAMLFVGCSNSEGEGGTGGSGGVGGVGGSAGAAGSAGTSGVVGEWVEGPGGWASAVVLPNDDPSTYSWGDVKKAGDIDNDGDLDMVLGGGTPGGSGMDHPEGAKPQPLIWWEVQTSSGGAGGYSTSYTRHVIAGSDWAQFSNDMVLVDFDVDGDLDIVVPDEQDPSGDNCPGCLYWYENPCATKPCGAEILLPWAKAYIGTSDGGGDPAQYGSSPNDHDWIKDLFVEDIDSDGCLDIMGRIEGWDYAIWFQDSSTGCQDPPVFTGATDAHGGNRHTTIIGGLGAGPPNGHGDEGGLLFDFDEDGDWDIIGQTGIRLNPCDPVGGACTGKPPRTAGNWGTIALPQATAGYDWWQYTSEGFKVRAADLDSDGKNDLMYTDSEGEVPGVWYRQGSTTATSDWGFYRMSDTTACSGDAVPTVSPPCSGGAHSLEFGDFDLDGDIDIMTSSASDSRFDPRPRFPGAFYIYSNPGDGSITSPAPDAGHTAWSIRVMDYGRPVPVGEMHDAYVFDLGNDGDLDIFGSASTEKEGPPGSVWENRTRDPAP